MDNYFILKDERRNPKFDARIQGILFNNRKEIICNPFNKLVPIDRSSGYYIKTIIKGSESGKKRDKLCLRIQNNESLFIIDDRIISFLNALCNNIEFYDLIIKEEDKILTDYKIINITNSIDCINHEESKLIYWELTHETVYNINELVLREDVIPQNLNIFLLGEVRGIVIFVHKRFKEAIEEKNITGFNFCKVEDFVF